MLTTVVISLLIMLIITFRQRSFDPPRADPTPPPSPESEPERAPEL